jgi:hypothetical protein
MSYKTKTLYISGTPVKILKPKLSKRDVLLISFLKRHSSTFKPPKRPQPDQKDATRH